MQQSHNKKLVLPAIKMETREVIPAPPKPAMARPRITCHNVAPAPLDLSQLESLEDADNEKCLQSATCDLPQSAAEGKEGVGDDERGFPAIKVAQFTILPMRIHLSLLF